MNSGEKFGTREAAVDERRLNAGLYAGEAMKVNEIYQRDKPV